MPYKLEEAEGGWYVVNSDTGDRKSKKPLTKKRAEAQMRALYYFTGAEAKKKEAALETITFQITAPADVLQRFAEFLKNEIEDAEEGEIEEEEAPQPPTRKAAKAKREEKSISLDIKSSPDVIERFVKFMAMLNKAAHEGHSNWFGMYLDGDGPDWMEVSGVDLPDVEYEYVSKGSQAQVETAKEVDSTPTGIPAHGPGGLFSTPGLGGKLVKAMIGGKKRKGATRKEWADSFAQAFKEAANV